MAVADENSLRRGGHATRWGNHAAMMKRTGIEPVTAPMAETNRAVVRPRSHSVADIWSATMSGPQRAEGKARRLTTEFARTRLWTTPSPIALRRFSVRRELAAVAVRALRRGTAEPASPGRVSPVALLATAPPRCRSAPAGLDGDAQPRCDDATAAVDDVQRNKRRRAICRGPGGGRPHETHVRDQPQRREVADEHLARRRWRESPRLPRCQTERVPGDCRTYGHGGATQPDGQADGIASARMAGHAHVRGSREHRARGNTGRGLERWPSRRLGSRASDQADGNPGADRQCRDGREAAALTRPCVVNHAEGHSGRKAHGTTMISTTSLVKALRAHGVAVTRFGGRQDRRERTPPARSAAPREAPQRSSSPP